MFKGKRDNKIKQKVRKTVVQRKQISPIQVKAEQNHQTREDKPQKEISGASLQIQCKILF